MLSQQGMKLGALLEPAQVNCDAASVATHELASYAYTLRNYLERCRCCDKVLHAAWCRDRSVQTSLLRPRTSRQFSLDFVRAT